MPEIMVSICCSVFNQERYLRTCLDGILSQQTNFPYEIIVRDDASTDHGAQILQEYEKANPGKFVILYEKENTFSKGVIPAYAMMRHARGKYVAFCEADDFWTSPDKLQKQVDFLEAHEDFSLCVHAAYCAHENGTLLKDRVFRPYAESREVSTDEVLDDWKFATASIMYRRSVQETLIPSFLQDCPCWDYATTAYFALKGRTYYFNDLMCAYRVESVGSVNWNWGENFQRHIVSNQKFLQMLDRIDQDSHYQHSAALNKLKQQICFNINVLAGDQPEAKKDTARYSAMGPRHKFELWLHYRCPAVFLRYRAAIKIVKHIKYHL